MDLLRYNYLSPIKLFESYNPVCINWFETQNSVTKLIDLQLLSEWLTRTLTPWVRVFPGTRTLICGKPVPVPGVRVFPG
jgi:hypothetical protein